MILYRDLGIMRLDERGIWIDEPIEDAIRAAAQDCPLPPEIPEEFWRKLEDSEGAFDEPAPPVTMPPAPLPADGDAVPLEAPAAPPELPGPAGPVVPLNPGPARGEADSPSSQEASGPRMWLQTATASLRRLWPDPDQKPAERWARPAPSEPDAIVPAAARPPESNLRRKPEPSETPAASPRPKRAAAVPAAPGARQESRSRRPSQATPQTNAVRCAGMLSPCCWPPC